MEISVNTVKVRKDLQDAIIQTLPGICVDNTIDYPCITVFIEDNNLGCKEITAIYIQNEWQHINNIDFE